MKKIVIFTASSVLLLAFILYLVFKPREVNFIKLKKTDFTYSILANCSVDYPKPLDIKYSYEVEVLKIYKKEGENLKKGDLIIQLDDKDDRKSLILASNNIVSLQNRIRNIKRVELPNLKEREKEAIFSLRQAENDLARAKELYEAGGISKSDLEKIQNNYEIKLSQYNQIKNTIENYESSGVLSDLNTQLENAKIDFEKIKERFLEKRIISPFSGKILKINVQEKERVSPNKVISTIIEKTNWLLVMNIDQRELSFLKPNIRSKVKFDSFPDISFNAVVSYICTQIDKEKGTCEVRLEIQDKNSELIKYGMSGYAEIFAETFTNVVVIPQRFVKNNRVFIYNNGKIFATNVNLRMVGENKFITTDLNDGDILVEVMDKLPKRIKLKKEVKI